DADLLLIASDVDGLYDRDPRGNPDARPVEAVAAVTPGLLDSAGGPGSSAGTGGMRTKLEAAQRASRAGIGTALFNGRRAEVLAGLAEGRLHGTLVQAAGSRVAVRKHWLHNAPAQAGAILVDAGAARAVVEKGASLLPGGVLGVEGDFHRGDIVEVHLRDDRGDRRIARGLSQYSAVDIRRVAGCHSRDIDARLGYNYGGNI